MRLKEPVFPEEILFLLVLHFVRKPQKKNFFRKNVHNVYSCGTFWTPSHCGERVSSAFNDENARVHEKKDDRPLSFRNAIALWLICKVSVPEREIIRERSAICVVLSEKGKGEVCRMEQVAFRERLSGA